MLNWSNTRVIARLKQTKPRRTESELLLRKRQQGKGHTYSALAEYCVVLLVVLLHQSFYDFDYTRAFPERLFYPGQINSRVKNLVILP